MNELSIRDGLDAMEVAAYLRRHPDFLAAFPDLAMSLVVPREQGDAASLASYQLQVLRERIRGRDARLHELIANAQENEALMIQVHHFTLGLIREATLEGTVRTIAAALTEDFNADRVSLVLFRGREGLPDADWLLTEPAGAGGLPAFADFLQRGEPLCGRLEADKLRGLFGAHAGEVRSAVLLPVGGTGMLAIGSADANRFHPGMGTVFLKLIAEAVAAALARFPPAQ